MYKWVSWVIRMGATALLLSFLSIWTTGYIVNSYMEAVIKQLELPIQTQPFALSGIWGKLWGAKDSSDPERKEAQAGREEEEEEEEQDEDESSGSRNNTPAAIDPGLEDEQVQESVPSPDSGFPVGSSLEELEEEEGASDAAPVWEEVIEIPSMTDTQRQSLYALVVSKLNQEQLKQLSGALKDGVTGDELTELQSMLKGVLTEDEYTEMIGLLGGQQE